MVQWLRALAALLEDLGLVPHYVYFSSRRSDALNGFLGHQAMIVVYRLLGAKHLRK